MILVLNLSKIVNSDTLEKLIWLWNQRSFQDCFHSPSLKYPCLWTTKTICIYMWSTLQLWSFLTLVRAFKHDFCMFFFFRKNAMLYLLTPLLLLFPTLTSQGKKRRNVNFSQSCVFFNHFVALGQRFHQSVEQRDTVNNAHCSVFTLPTLNMLPTFSKIKKISKGSF